jgi:hypothetical protein
MQVHHTPIAAFVKRDGMNRRSQGMNRQKLEKTAAL